MPIIGRSIATGFFSFDIPLVLNNYHIIMINFKSINNVLLNVKCRDSQSQIIKSKELQTIAILLDNH